MVCARSVFQAAMNVGKLIKWVGQVWLFFRPDENDFQVPDTCSHTARNALFFSID
jgi:hypothetical protein